MKFSKSIAFRLTIILLSGIIILKSHQRQRVSEEKRTVIQVTGEGNSLAEQVGYSNLAVEEISKLVEKYQMQNSTVGVWEGENKNPYGTLFLFRLALDYFRVTDSHSDRASWEKTHTIREINELAGIEYLVSKEPLDHILALGYQPIFDKGWLHLYHCKQVE